MLKMVDDSPLNPDSCSMGAATGSATTPAPSSTLPIPTESNSARCQCSLSSPSSQATSRASEPEAVNTTESRTPK
ncbi:MAG: hypothetical protein BWY79_00862 [Actinobacteria bacterium ADurb.Bin444]|nr:MAG: hypothetical protein BWY79_00862 [Actinobacteria bacterium ADurb.Bin444]